MRRTQGRSAVPRILMTSFLVALPFLCHYLVPVMVIVPKPYTYLGIILLVGGLALATWVSMLFRKAGTSFELHGESSLLVTSGAFRFSRNPMYLGMLAWLIGLAVLLGSLVSFLFPLLFFLVANFCMVPLEERSMERLFGMQFTDYKQCVRRWL